MVDVDELIELLIGRDRTYWDDPEPPDNVPDLMRLARKVAARVPGGIARMVDQLRTS